MKKSCALALICCLASSAASVHAAIKYWDINAATPGSGQGTATGTWNTSGSFWTTDSTGSSATTTFTAGDAIVLSAGTDATSAWTLNSPSGLTCGGITVEEGTVSLTGGATTIGTSVLTVQSGATLSIPTSLQFGVSSGATIVLNGGTMRNTQAANAGSFVSSLFTTITLGSASTISFTGTGFLNILNATPQITGTGPLTKAGGGVLAMVPATAGHNWTGGTIITGGELRVRTGSGPLPATTDLTVTSPGVFNLNGLNQTIGSLTGTGNVGCGAGTLTINGSASTAFNGALKNIANAGAGAVATGNGRLIKQGSGTITFAGANDINGTVTLTAGGITVNSGASLCGPICDVAVNGGTLTLSNTLQTIENLSGSGGTIILGTGHTLSSDPIASTTYSGIIAGLGGLTRSNANATTRTLTLTGANTYDGNTMVSQGIIAVGSATALGSAIGFTEVASGAEVLFTGAATSFTCNEPFRIAGPGSTDNGAIAIIASATPILSGSVTLTADATVTVSSTAAVTFNNANAFTSLANQNLTLQGGAGAGAGGTISGIISLGTGSLTKLQGGPWVLSAANSYSGGTTVGAGTLDVRKDGGLGSGNVTVASGATLKLGSGTANTYINSSANLLLGTGTPVVNLAFTGAPNTVNALSFDGGTTFKAAGTWGAVGSGAQHTNSRFTGTGLLLVTTGPATTTALTDDTGSPTTYGAPVTFTATVTGSSPTGTVQFKDGASNLGAPVPLIAAQAQLVIDNLSIAGSPHSITAVYSGDDNNNGSTSSAVSHTVDQQRVAVLSGTRPYDGTTTAAAAILSVANKVGTDDVFVASGSGTLASAGPGPQSIISLGDLALGGAAAPNYTLSGASGSVTIVVATTNVVSSSPNPSLPGSNVTFVATVTNVFPGAPQPTGTVQFKTNHVAWGEPLTLDGSGTATFVTNTLPHGSNTVSVEYAGDAIFLASTGTVVQIVDAPPASANMEAITTRNHPLVLMLAKLLGKATDSDGDVLAVTAAGPGSTNGPANNVVLDSGAGTITYTPATNFTGSDSFTYTISDGFFGGTVSPTVTVTINSGDGGSPNIVVPPAYDGDTGTFRVTFAGIPGYTYNVEISDSPIGPWTFLQTATAAADGLFEVVDTTLPPPPARYYRTTY